MQRHRVQRVFVYGLAIVLDSFILYPCNAQKILNSSSLVIARVHYRGGGDWYNDPSSLPNLCRYLKEKTTIDAIPEEAKVSLLDETLFSYPFLYLTGHGRIVFSEEEASRLRSYLLHGGFLYADDDYGMDSYFRTTMKTVFPDRDFVELPFSHGIYNIQYPFPEGLPKIHEHNNKPPRGLGLFDEANRLMVFYTFETNISDGWADPEIHQDPEEKRLEAFRMGTNIVVWALTH